MAVELRRNDRKQDMSLTPQDLNLLEFKEKGCFMFSPLDG